MKKSMKFSKIASFYPDLKGLVAEDSGFERKAVAGVLEPNGTGFRATLTTPETDRDGDIILPQGLDFDFYTGTLCWNHALDQLPIGKVVDVTVTAAGATGTLVFAEGYAFAEDVRTLVAQGMLTGVSIGYIPKQVAMKGTREFAAIATKYNLDVRDCNRIVTRAEMIEISAAPVGCNRSAVIHAMAQKSFVPGTDTCAALGLDDDIAKTMLEIEQRVMDMKRDMQQELADLAGVVTGMQNPQNPQNQQKPAPEPEADVVPVTPAEPEALAKAEAEAQEAPAEPVVLAPALVTVLRLGRAVRDPDAATIETKALALRRGALV